MVVATLVNPSVVHQRAITPRLPSAVEVQVSTVRRVMIVSRVVDAVLPGRRDAGIVSAMIPRRRRAVRDLVLSGLVTREMSAVLLEVVRILRLRSAARTVAVRRERHVARMNVVDQVDTADQTAIAKLVRFLQELSPRHMRSLRLL